MPDIKVQKVPIMFLQGAGYKNSKHDNVFIGYRSGYSNTSGDGNTFIGQSSGNKNSTGDQNTFIGRYAGTSNTEGESNTFIGAGAGYNNTIGSNNVFIGHGAGADNNNVSDKLYIGNIIYGDFEEKKVAINTEIASRTFYVNGDAGGTSSWSSNSDKRLKKEINTIDNALAKVLKLRGVQFQWKSTDNHPEGKQIGFIAQEAKDIVPEVIDEKDGYFSMKYAPIVALLVEAIKELNAEKEAMKKIICSELSEHELCQGDIPDN